ncbi:alpha/beta hydrolase [Hypericibacter adhaerens]|uniref:Alpha/beta hydrolase n=1 Tax=Hypericibacter adhaerens TaxID=2602016 RepID=A0A5J6N4J5_9PROT|nr:alpha/beta hydrolase [Hypericibacter adhaerens]
MLRQRIGWRREAPVRPLSLALQGGGSFGAFTWGVLERLIEEPGTRFDALSGTSAGALNAVVLADGLATGGPEAAREKLQRFWKRASDAALFTPFGPLGNAGMTASAATTLALSTQLVSPYQFNPLGLNPLRAILADLVDFERLRQASPMRLLIAATNVQTGRLRLFRESELTLEMVLASACLPLLHHAIEIEGEWYWDGGLSANPPLRPLALETEARDLVIVQLTPERVTRRPQSSPEIARRVNQISFNNPLQTEMEALADLVALYRREPLLLSRRDRRLRHLKLHRIAAEDAVDGLEHSSALALDWSFLTRLKESGRRAAETWVKATSLSPPPSPGED